MRYKLPCPAERLVANRGPMLLVKSLLAVEKPNDPKTRSVIEAIVPEQGIFIRQNSPKASVEEAYLIQLSAQAIAAVNGIDHPPNTTEPWAGFLAAIDDFNINQLPTPGSQLWIETRRLIPVGNTTSFSVLAYNRQGTLAWGTLRIWRTAMR